MTRSRLFFLAASILLIVAGAAATIVILNQMQHRQPPQITGADPSNSIPTFAVTQVARGLENPWDIGFLPSGTLLVTERSGAVSKISTTGAVTELETPNDVYAQGEGGMLGMAVDPAFATNRFVYVCFNSDVTSAPQVRVARYVLNQAETNLESRKDIVTGIPANTSGRHSGCRIAFGSDGNLWVGTGDAADETEPQNKRTLGGKILRVNREGQPVTGNITDGDKRIYSYGHRNTQGLAFYKTIQGGSYGVSVEHGPDKDDEINPLKPGNFGWAPGNNYDESVSMTDTVKFPSAVKSIWSSGDSILAVSGADFIHGDKWKDWNGRLAVAVLKDKHIRLFTMKNGEITGEQQLLQNEYGRIRTVKQGSNQEINFTTDNGTNDGVYRLVAS